MATIGGYTVFYVRNAVDIAGPKTRRIVRPGVVGAAFMVSEWTGEPTDVETWTMCSNSTAAGTAMNNYTALRTGTVTVVDDYGRTRSNIYVHDVQETACIRRQYATDGNGYKLVCRWRLEETL
jgi:hypothetical protein